MILSFQAERSDDGDVVSPRSLKTSLLFSEGVDAPIRPFRRDSFRAIRLVVERQARSLSCTK